jgi:hypothetical protein
MLRHMMKLAGYLAFILAFWVVSAASQTVIKGHHLGETVQEFLHAEPNIKAQLSSCPVGQHTAIEIAYCKILVAVLENGSPLGLMPDPFSESPMWTFADGRLSAMYITFPSSTVFATVEADLTKRIGAQPAETMPAYTNAYGATWNNQVANWLTPELSAELEAEHNPAKPSIKLGVMSRSLYDSLVKKRANAPSPLD